MPAANVAHIYPFCLLKNDQDGSGMRSVFWKALHLFWPKDVVASWEAELFQEGQGVETVTNLTSLTGDSHWCLNHGYFAFQPVEISPDEKTLVLRFV